MTDVAEHTLTDADVRGLTARLVALATHLGIPDADATSALGAGPLLAAVTKAVRDDGSKSAMWTALAVFTGVFPSPEEVVATWRQLTLARPELAHRVLLEAGVRSPRGFARLELPVDIVENVVVVDVDFCATHLHNTGIQRVVRQTMHRWHRDHDVTFVAWAQDGHAMRALTAAELRRVVNFQVAETLDEVDEANWDRIIVPVNCTVVLPEVPAHSLCPPLVAVAQFSSNTVSMIGYDAIPVLSADTLLPEETERFGRYLTVVKYADRVAGISAAATEEFAGFVGALGAQGLVGPTTDEVMLPVDAPDRGAVAPVSKPVRPLILCVGSQEMRKNQLSVVFAAEVLLREGLDFSLLFIGGGQRWFTRLFDARVRRLSRLGLDVRVRRGVPDAEMLEAYRTAYFTVFPSYHEGYGLPVAESLALGVPVVTTGYGSTAEIAADGGCLVIDPRDDSSLVDAMRTLLTQPAVHDRLVAEIAERPPRTWDDYAADLWETLVLSGGAA